MSNYSSDSKASGATGGAQGSNLGGRATSSSDRGGDTKAQANANLNANQVKPAPAPVSSFERSTASVRETFNPVTPVFSPTIPAVRKTRVPYDPLSSIKYTVTGIDSSFGVSPFEREPVPFSPNSTTITKNIPAPSGSMYTTKIDSSGNLTNVPDSSHYKDQSRIP